jgi:PAS domain S-box-containing protein
LIREERVTRALVEQQLAHVETAWRDAEQQLDSLEQGRLATEAEARQLAAEHTDAQRNLEEARRAFQRTLDLVSSEYAEAQATLVSELSERDARLEEQAARHALSLQAVELDRSQIEVRFQTTVADRDREIEQLQDTLRATALELVRARTRCEELQTTKPELQRQLDESRLEMRRQFHRAPVALGRCTRDGVLTHFNRAFADLVGYRNPNELRGTDFAKTIFEYPDDLSWLIERCLSTHARESVETAWKRKHGERIVVRVSAVESAPDLAEIAVEDITDLRALQERLAQDDPAHPRSSGLWALGSRLWARVRGSD